MRKLKFQEEAKISKNIFELFSKYIEEQSRFLHGKTLFAEIRSGQGFQRLVFLKNAVSLARVGLRRGIKRPSKRKFASGIGVLAARRIFQSQKPATGLFKNV